MHDLPVLGCRTEEAAPCTSNHHTPVLRLEGLCQADDEHVLGFDLVSHKDI